MSTELQNNKLWFQKILNKAALAMIDKILNDRSHRRYIEDKEIQLIKKGIETGVIKVKDNLFTISKEVSKKYDAFTLNREYFTQFATLVSLVTEYNYPSRDCWFEYHLMDICVFKNRKPFIYVETKVNDYQAEKLYKEIKKKYSKNLDLFKTVPDRGNDALRKAKYIFKDKPKYLWLVTPKQKMVFIIEYTKKGFGLHKTSDIPLFN